MPNLTYEGAFDAYHTIFRLLKLFGLSEEGSELEADRLRIADFYMTFPEAIKNFRAKPEARKLKNAALREVSIVRYGIVPDFETLFARMIDTQTAAIATLARENYIDAKMLDEGWVKPQVSVIPSKLFARCKNSNNASPDLSVFLAHLFTDYKVAGPDGLKHRSKLLDHRYDDL